MDIQQFDQLGHGPHCGCHIARTEKPFGLLCQLPGYDRCRLTRAKLGAKRSDGGTKSSKRKIDGGKEVSKGRGEKVSRGMERKVEERNGKSTVIDKKYLRTGEREKKQQKTRLAEGAGGNRFFIKSS